MAEIDIEKTKKLVDSLSTLVEKIEKFSVDKEVIFVICTVIFSAIIYFIIKLIIEFCKDRRINRLIDENTKIIGECKEVMRNVYNLLNTQRP